MKVLVISHNRENSGWGIACREFIKCLSTQVETVVRPIVLGSNFVDSEIEILERKPLKDITHVIQYVLPYYMSYTTGFEKVIGITCTETNNLEYTSWPTLMNLNDEIWNFGMGQKESIFKKVIDSYQPFELRTTPKKININADGLYKFYCIAEGIKRKNIQLLIRAYLTEFESSEPVSLIIKSSIPGQNKEQSYNTIMDMIQQIMHGIKKYSDFTLYPRISVSTDSINYADLLGVHQACDCFMNVSYGESICYPLLEAAAMNKAIITTPNKYFSFIDGPQENVLSVEEEPCYGQVFTFPTYNTSRESWFAPKISELMIKMRTEYNKRSNYQYNINKLSHQKMGEEYLNLLFN